MKTETRIGRTMSVSEAVRLFPATTAVFSSFGIDACCGGAATIADAAVRNGAEVGELLEVLHWVVEADR